MPEIVADQFEITADELLIIDRTWAELMEYMASDELYTAPDAYEALSRFEDRADGTIDLVSQAASMIREGRRPMYVASPLEEVLAEEVRSGLLAGRSPVSIVRMESDDCSAYAAANPRAPYDHVASWYGPAVEASGDRVLLTVPRDEDSPA